MVVLIADDDAGTLQNLALAIEDEGHEVLTAKNTAAALRVLRRRPVDVVITDVVMPDGSGMDVLRFVNRANLDCGVILMTGYESVPTAVEAIRAGAFDYLTKPVELDHLFELMRRATAGRQPASSGGPEPNGRARKPGRGRIVGDAPAMRDLFSRVDLIAPSDATVLITGESGTGKELIADAIHLGSKRADGTFVKVNCMVFADGLVESELFGHERGSFTSAHKKRKGRFELADGGTLFLDEIGDLAPAVQLKLLRVLQEREVERVGGATTIPVDVRLICATNRNVEDEVRAGRLREELYYRINVVRLEVPPLRERLEDVPRLLEHFLAHFSRQHDCAVLGLTPQTSTVLGSYAWPGNVRELRNLVESLVLTSPGPLIDVARLPPHIRDHDAPPTLRVRIGETLAAVERRVTLATLRSCGGNKSETARMLGIGLRTLYRRLEDYEPGE